MAQDSIQTGWTHKTAMEYTDGTDDGDLGGRPDANSSREIRDLTGFPIELLLDASRIPIRSPSQYGHRQGVVAAVRGNRPLRLQSGPRNQLGQAGRLAGWQIHRVLAFIGDNLNRTIRVRDLSYVAQRSLAHFCRAFKQTFGVPPQAYVVRRRLDYAGRLMLATDAPLCEIALTCGFSDQAHFSRSFRQSTGQTPAAWRRERRTEARPGQTSS
jgi:AraC-like DNA-binding protein